MHIVQRRCDIDSLENALMFSDFFADIFHSFQRPVINVRRYCGSNWQIPVSIEKRNLDMNWQFYCCEPLALFGSWWCAGLGVFKIKPYRKHSNIDRFSRSTAMDCFSIAFQCLRQTNESEKNLYEYVCRLWTWWSGGQQQPFSKWLCVSSSISDGKQKHLFYVESWHVLSQKHNETSSSL